MLPFSVRLDCLLMSAAISGTECLVVWVLLCGESVPQKTSVSFTCKPQCAVKRQDCSHRDPGGRRKSGSKGWAWFSETWYQKEHLKGDNAFRVQRTLQIGPVRLLGSLKFFLDCQYHLLSSNICILLRIVQEEFVVFFFSDCKMFTFSVREQEIPLSPAASEICICSIAAAFPFMFVSSFLSYHYWSSGVTLMYVLQV